MKKMIAIMITLALVIGVLAVPALAEEETGTVDQVTSATQTSQNGRNSHGNRPQMPGQSGQNDQAPQAPGQNDQMPQMPGRNSQNGQNSQQPVRGGKNNRQGKDFSGQNGKQLIFDQLLTDGVITQETYDAIKAWMNEKTTQAQQEETAPAEGTKPPTMPEGAQDSNAAAKTELLKSLLESGAITQEQYDLLSSSAPAAPAAAPAT